MLHQNYQRDRQKRHEHHQLEIVDECNGLRLRAHYLIERRTAAKGGEIELVRIVTHDLPVGRDLLDKCALRRGRMTYLMESPVPCVRSAGASVPRLSLKLYCDSDFKARASFRHEVDVYLALLTSRDRYQIRPGPSRTLRRRPCRGPTRF
jgi:hypothetical protein